MSELIVIGIFLVAILFLVFSYLNSKDKTPDDKEDHELFLKLDVLRIVLLICSVIAFIVFFILN